MMSNYEVQIACARCKTCSHSISIDGHGLSVPSLSRSASAGLASNTPSTTPSSRVLKRSKGFALPVLCMNTGAVAVPVFSA